MFAEGESTAKVKESVGRYLDGKRKAEANGWAEILRSFQMLADDGNRQNQELVKKLEANEKNADDKIGKMEKRIESLERKNQALLQKLETNEKNADDKIFQMQGRIDSLEQKNQAFDAQIKTGDGKTIEMQNRINSLERRSGGDANKVNGKTNNDGSSEIENQNAGNPATRRCGRPPSPLPERNAGQPKSNPYHRSSAGHSKTDTFRGQSSYNRPYDKNYRYRSSATRGFGVPFICENCGHRFNHWKEYNAHYYHVCAKQFRCPFCKKTLESARTLEEHIKRHQ